MNPCISQRCNSTYTHRIRERERTSSLISLRSLSDNDVGRSSTLSTTPTTLEEFKRATQRTHTYVQWIHDHSVLPSHPTRKSTLFFLHCRQKSSSGMRSTNCPLGNNSVLMIYRNKRTRDNVIRTKQKKGFENVLLPLGAQNIILIRREELHDALAIHMPLNFIPSAVSLSLSLVCSVERQKGL